MASPQRENGFTGVANEILDNLAMLKINGTQFRIIMVVFRYTYGFQRCEHDLSITFLAKATGINPRVIRRELKTLIDFNIIIVSKESTKIDSRVLKFNKDYDTWQEGTKKSSGDKKDPSQGTKKSSQEGTKKTPKKEIKENSKENMIILNPDEAAFISILETVKSYPIDRVKDIEMYKTLQQRYPDLNLIESLRDWHIYKLDNPLKPKDNPRAQINTSFKNCVKWGKNIEKSDKKPGSIPCRDYSRLKL